MYFNIALCIYSELSLSSNNILKSSPRLKHNWKGTNITNELVPLVPKEGNSRTSFFLLLIMAKARVSPAKRWSFTWNNYPADACGSKGPLVPLLNSLGKYIIGKEVGESGTPHLQGYIEFNKKVRALSVGLPVGIHWEKSKGNRTSNIAYCSKDGDYIYHKLHVPAQIAKMKFSMLRPEQKAISCLFSGREDALFGRIIYWFWEATGCWGKSVTAKHLVDCRGAIVLGGKHSDILCGVAAMVEKNGECPPLVVFDIPRACGARCSLSAMEAVKNGLFFSGKYESKMVRFNSPHCAVFSNEKPDFKSMSADRWRVRNVAHWSSLMNEVRGTYVPLL